MGQAWAAFPSPEGLGLCDSNHRRYQYQRDKEPPYAGRELKFSSTKIRSMFGGKAMDPTQVHEDKFLRILWDDHTKIIAID